MAEDHYSYMHESFPSPTFSDTVESSPSTYDAMLTPRAGETLPNPIKKSKKKTPYYM